MALANGLAAALFIVSAALQFNDPDPIRWIAIYSAGASVCFLYMRAPQYRVPAVVVAVAAFAWATTLAYVLRDMVFSDLLKTMKAETPVIEDGREFLGLMIVGCWMVVLALLPRRDLQKS